MKQLLHTIAVLFLSGLLVLRAEGRDVVAEEIAKLPPPAKRQVDYERDVRPLLVKHCQGCHGPEKQESGFRVDTRQLLLTGGDHGTPAIIVGKSESSPLVRFTAGLEKDLVMPPEGNRLSADEIGVLRAWIDQGLKMPAADAAEPPLNANHWSLRPVVRPTPPDLKSAWVANPIDAFILTRLQAAQLEPSPPAARRDLIRRVYLDMLGLLPTPEEVAAFAGDDSPTAFETLVDRVLANPHYGERWGRHWLDVVRYAESNGFETNYERPNAYQYRDWVIRALNADLPYDKFVTAQLAGDSVGEDAATGFLVGGAYDAVKSPDPNLTAQQRQDELADMVNATGTAFLGLTVGCARCHSHKFDPITQTDFYALQAVFSGVRHGERAIKLGNDSQESNRQREATEQAARIAKLNAELQRLRPAPFTGEVAIIDDEHLERVKPLVEPRGRGVNPQGTERGEQSDPGGAGRAPNISGGRYAWWDNRAGIDMLSYRPQLAGEWRIWLSWGCGWNTHTTDAQYLLDSDGDLTTKQDQQLIATVNQQLFADGSGRPVGQPLWSGFYDAGTHKLTANSVLLVRGGKQGEAITADVVVCEQATADTASNGKVAARSTQPHLLPPVNARQNDEHFPAVETRYLRFSCEATNSAEPCLDELEIWTVGENSVNVALATAGAKISSSGDYGGDPKHRLEHLNDGKYGNDRSWISSTPGTGWVQIEFPQPVKIERVVWGRDRALQYQDRLATRYRIDAAEKPNEWRAVASSQRRVPFGVGPGDALGYRTLGLTGEAARQVEAGEKQLREWERQLKQLTAQPMAYAGQFAQPGATYRLHRGDPLAPREPVQPEALTALRKPVGSLELSSDAAERDRRAALARWITAPNNPLTPRVIVNRLWQYHFGRGIVGTPSDFGKMGELPTHPELLDWLAAELPERQWSLKQIHRLILLSNTYRQASAPRAAALAKDKESALLWRYPPRRIEAEAIRDNILLVSGALDQRMFGPGFMLFEPNTNYSRNWIAKDEFGPAEFRRMIYAVQLRMKRDAVFGAFDCPDGGQITPRRSSSTTPVQALSLFNSPFILQQSRLLGERVERESGKDAVKQIRRVFELTLGRSPRDDEAAAAADLTRLHGLTAFCRAMLNCNEFLFLP